MKRIIIIEYVSSFMNDKVKAVSGLIKAYATLHAPNSLYSIEEFSKTTN